MSIRDAIALTSSEFKELTRRATSRTDRAEHDRRARLILYHSEMGPRARPRRQQTALNTAISFTIDVLGGLRKLGQLHEDEREKQARARRGTAVG